MWGGPPEEAEAVDWTLVNKEAEEPLDDVITYKAAWGSPRKNGKSRRNRLSFEAAPGFPAPPA